MDNPADALKELPTYTPNPNLSRDVLGLVFSQYRENLTHAIKDQPVQTASGPVPARVAIDALKFISIRTCGATQCDRYQITAQHMLYHNHRHECDICDYDNIIMSCDVCMEDYCMDHLYKPCLLNLTKEPGDIYCINCLVESGCIACLQGGNPVQCEGYQQAIACAMPLGFNGHNHINYHCTGYN